MRDTFKLLCLTLYDKFLPKDDGTPYYWQEISLKVFLVWIPLIALLIYGVMDLLNFARNNYNF